MGILILLRGLPGSGKTTVAKELFSDAIHFEADMFFVDKETGHYNFDFGKLHLAHSWCQNSVSGAMEKGVGKIVVSNTFTKESEMKFYYEIAEKYGYKVVSLIVENRHGGQNVHDVPDETLIKMRNRFTIKL